MKIQEASKDITKRINSIPSLKTSFIEENTQKDQENMLSSYSIVRITLGKSGATQQLEG
jgi:hypothetical protein